MSEFKKVDLNARGVFKSALDFIVKSNNQSMSGSEGEPERHPEHKSERQPEKTAENVSEKKAGNITENQSFVTNFLWADYFDIAYAQIEDCIVLRYTMDGETSFAFPFGSSDENKLSAVRKLSRLCKQQGIPFILGPVTEADKKLLEAELPIFDFQEERGEFEYVYRREKLVSLDEFSDLRYKKKLIRQLSESGALRFEKISSENMKDCIQIENEWLEDKLASADIIDEEEILNSEHDLILKALKNFNQLSLFGGMLYFNEKPVAFTIAEELSPDTVLIHIEKALKGYKGAYQAINNYFVSSDACSKYKYVNREEDTGDPNLRQAKMSYRPDILVKIYSAKERLPEFRFLSREEYQGTKEICNQIFTGEENDAFFEEFFKEKIYSTRIAVLELIDSVDNTQSYDSADKPDDTPADNTKNKIVATTQVWNIKVSSSNGDVTVPYIYATATLPQYRLLGYRDMLIRKLFEIFRAEGAPWTFLAPENTNIWAGLGFDISFDVNEKEKDILEIDDEIDQCLVHEIIKGSFAGLPPASYKVLYFQY